MFGLKSVTVYPGATALLYRDGAYVRTLGLGRTSWFDPFNRTRAIVLPTYPILQGAALVLDVMSRDQFAFRLTLATICKLTDPRAFVESGRMAAPDHALSYSGSPLHFETLTARLQDSIHRHVSSKSLETFIEDPRAGFPDVIAEINGTLVGAKVADLLLVSLNMPPEIRRMFTEVERAKREGQASLERARAEQASLRALSNAARLFKSNPELANLRLLQTIESSKGPKTFVLGQSGYATGTSDASSE